MWVWRPEDALWESILLFHHMEPGSSWELNSCRQAWPQRPSLAEASRWANYVHFSLFFFPFHTED